MSRVLVVDDDEHLRSVLATLLETAGYQVTTAGDGAEGLQRLEREPFDLMLLDVWMPRMTGLEVLTQLKSRAPSLRVILLTADDTPDTVLHALRDQAYQFVRKPFDPEALLAAVGNALGAGAAVQPIEVLSAQPHWVELLVPCQLEVADRIQGFLMTLEAGLPEKVRESVGIAFRELLLNAIEWGGKFDPTRKVRIAYLRTERLLLYRIADPGSGFRFDALEHSALANPADNPVQHLKVREEKGIRAGGFGILMTRAMVDELLYNEAQNEVVFIKYLDKPGD
ncbi:MAG TPA: response regulator [Candidatus Xenobia bacterium]|nr:response regulator [Candidatus Xenobia bacterium]